MQVLGRRQQCGLARWTANDSVRVGESGFVANLFGDSRCATAALSPATYAA